MKIKVGYYFSRNSELIRIDEVSEDEVFSVIGVRMSTGYQFTWTINGHHTLYSESILDLIKYLTPEEYPEYYI